MTTIDPMDCRRINLAGVTYDETTCLYPGLKPFFSQYEMNYDPVPVRDWMVDRPWIPLLAVALYGLGIVAGKEYFRSRSPWNWRKSLALWNFFLSAFSTIGFWKVLPTLIHNVTHYSLRDNLCLDPEAQYGSGSSGFWVQLFILSKIPELVDTFFIIIHKKKLIFLHWYHHVTVLLYCWHSYVTKTPSGVFFCCMNYGVHAVMYFYYFLMAVKIRPNWAMLITSLQISQMIGGVVLTALSFVFAGSENCWISPENNNAAFVMYGSYLFLFLQFFVGRYFGISGTTKGKGKKLD